MKSKISKITNRQKSVRTIIPRSVTELLNLKAGDDLEWEPLIENDEIKFVVTKSKE